MYSTVEVEFRSATTCIRICPAPWSKTVWRTKALGKNCLWGAVTKAMSGSVNSQDILVPAVPSPVPAFPSLCSFSHLPSPRCQWPHKVSRAHCIGSQSRGDGWAALNTRLLEFHLEMFLYFFSLLFYLFVKLTGICGWSAQFKSFSPFHSPVPSL